MGPILDGISGQMADAPQSEAFRLAEVDPVDVKAALRDARAEVLVCYVPVGAEAATRYYAQACLDAGVAFVNAVPTFIASDKHWAARFRMVGLPIIGDDVKSQVGATILHRSVARLLNDRGYMVTRSYQLNFGGNADFLNMLDRDRLTSKKRSKTQAVASEMPVNLDPGQLHVSPSDYVRWLRDKKIAYIHVDAQGFGGAPLELELRLSVEDSPNSAAVVLDAIRCAKLALDRGFGGPIEPVCAYYMKSPPRQLPDADARSSLLAWIMDEGGIPA